ncbi:hypothetical protein J4479_00625 [Candidatus Woesearchaeota archaeon]|nr:hypothetical protein [Candidatus Woesearchaeota archaeon]
MDLSLIKQALQEVYSENQHYYFISILSALAIYSFNAVFHNFRLALLTPNLFISLILGFHETMSIYSIIFLVIISVLTGILVSMTIFLLRRQIKDGIYASGVGVIASVIAPACSSCALGLLGLLGLSSLLAVLPFKGIEIGILGIIIVLAAVNSLAKKIVAQTCPIPKNSPA